MAAALIVLPFCSDGSIVGFVIGVVMSVFVVGGGRSYYIIGIWAQLADVSRFGDYF